MAKDILDAVYGCLIGGAIGDALGAPVEGWYHHEIKEKYGRLDKLIPSLRGNTGINYGENRKEPGDAGAVTDDSTMRHYLSYAIARKGGRITPEDYAAVLVEHMNPFRVWRSDRIVLEKLRLGMNPWETGKNNMPNGAAAMAIAPIGIINAGDPQQAYQDGFVIASVTQDGVDRDAAATVAAAVAAAFAPGATVNSVLDQAIACGSFLISRYIQLAIDMARETNDIELFTQQFYDQMLYWQSPQPPHKGKWNKAHFFSGSSLEMVPAALGIFYLCEGDVNRCIVEGVAFGRDNDTIASVAANIAGAMQGASAIQDDWIQRVETANTKLFEELEGDANANFFHMAQRLVSALHNEAQSQQDRLTIFNQLLNTQTR